MSAQLVDDLRTLHEAGKIRSPWLPGMKLVGAYKDYPVRVHAFGERPFDTEDVANEEPLRWWVEPETREGGPYKGPHLPDLTDAATVGCLAALAREAMRDPTLAIDCHTGEDEYIHWSVFGSGPRHGPEFEGPWRDTEGEAWAAVLHAAAEAVGG